MKHFKHHNSGMSFIEIVAALAILAIFGSSIFIMQSYLFDRLLISQRKLFAALNIQSQRVLYEKKILEEVFEQKGPLKESLAEKKTDFQHPDMQVTIQSKTGFDETSFKNFKNLYLFVAQAEQEDKEYGRSYSFAYIPKVPKK